MPESFNRCVRQGGRVRTVGISKTKYMRVCYKGGKAYAGHVRVKKKTAPVRHTKPRGKR